MKLRFSGFVAFVGVWTCAAFAQTTLHTKTTLVVVPTLVQTRDKDLAWAAYDQRAASAASGDGGFGQKQLLGGGG